MKTLLTLDEAFNYENCEEIEAAVYELNSAGIFDPNFIPNAKSHLNSLDAIEVIDNFLPREAFRAQNKRISFQ
jgi:hypothetical protein